VPGTRRHPQKIGLIDRARAEDFKFVDGAWTVFGLVEGCASVQSARNRSKSARAGSHTNRSSSCVLRFVKRLELQAGHNRAGEKTNDPWLPPSSDTSCSTAPQSDM
jgi:hypothetical protein